MFSTSTKCRASLNLGGSYNERAQLVLEVKDIRDEVKIPSYLLTQQKGVWEKLRDISRNIDGSINLNDISQKDIEMWKGPGFALNDVEEMDKIAQRIQDSVCATSHAPYNLLILSGELCVGARAE